MVRYTQVCPLLLFTCGFTFSKIVTMNIKRKGEGQEEAEEKGEGGKGGWKSRGRGGGDGSCSDSRSRWRRLVGPSGTQHSVPPCHGDRDDRRLVPLELL